MGTKPAAKQKKQTNSKSPKKKILRNKAEKLLQNISSTEETLLPEYVKSIIHNLEVHQIELEIQNEELQQAQHELLESRDRYADLYENAPVGYMTINDKGMVIEANMTMTDMLETERQHIINKRFSQFIFKDDQDIYFIFHRKLSRGNEKLSCELRIIPAEGHPFWAKLDFGPKREIGDDSIHYRISITDISEIKHVEEKLRTVDIRFDHVLKLMKNGLGVYKAIDKGNDFIIVHSYRTELPRLNDLNNNVTGKRLLEVFPEIEEQGLLDVIKRVWRTGKPENHSATDYAGKDIAGWRENYVFKLPTGEIVSIYEDITEKKKLDMALADSELLFRSIFETSPDPISIIRLQDSKIIAINHRFLELFRLTESEVIGKTGLDINIWEDLQKRKKFLDTLFKDGVVRNFESRFNPKSGEILTLQVSAKILPYKNEQHIIAIFHDFTDLKNAEKALKTSHNLLKKRYKLQTDALKDSEIKYSTLIEGVLTGVFMIVEYEIFFTNDQFAKIFGYKKKELLNKSIIDMITPGNRDAFKNEIHGMSEESEEFEIKGVKKDGSTVYLLAKNTLVDFEGEKAVLGNVVDITSRKLAEKEKHKLDKELNILSTKLLATEELERKRIAGEIHDSIGQALSAIKFSIENSLIAIEDGSISSSQKSLEKIIPLTQQAIEEVRKIVMDLRPSILDDLGIKATISWFCREFESIYTDIHVETAIHVNEDDIPVQMKTIIYRILQEAFNNAAKHSHTNHIHLNLERTGDGLELIVKDTGCGFIVEEILARTADRRGMGLASMRERALLSGGGINIKSAPGVGTVIQVSWPLTAIVSG